MLESIAFRLMTNREKYVTYSILAMGLLAVGATLLGHPDAALAMKNK